MSDVRGPRGGDRGRGGRGNQRGRGRGTIRSRGGFQNNHPEQRRGGGARGNGGRGTNHNLNQIDNQNTDAVEGDEPAHRERNENHKHFERRGPVFGFKRLHGFLALTSDEVILQIATDSKHWEEFLKSDDVKPANPRNYLHLVMQILTGKVIGETSLPNQQVDICVPTTCENFQKYIREQCSMMTSTQRNHARAGNSDSGFTEIDKSLETFLQNVLAYSEFMLKKMPEISIDFLQGIALTAFGAASLRSSDPVFSTLKEKFERLLKEMEEKLRAQEIKANKLSSRRRQEFTDEEVNEMHSMEAPEDFKELSIIPTVTELMSREEVFLRPNKTTGAYQDAHHYLDVQFRLLREDFVRPLKQGVQDFMKHRSEYMSKKKKMPLGTIRIYNDVQIVRVELIRDTTIFKIQLLEESYTKIRWDKSKRLLPGSLLVFTADLFKSAFFASVASRNIEELKKGIVSIVWEGDGPMWDRDDEYLMVECEVYFEAYRHSLQTLKELELEQFPMYKFIVEASSDVSPPTYLENATDFMKLQLQNGEEKYFSPLLEAKWPSSEELGLDANQFIAFQAAITKQFAIIQGPPGTGKTFLGLKIAETLLTNVSSRGPILVVCYTNHALDQFLEGIMDIYEKTIGGDAPIVRVGGRSQSERLNHYTLANVGRRKRHTMPKGFWPNRGEILSNIDECSYRRSTIMDAISSLRDLQGIVDFENLSVWNQLSIEFPTAMWKCFKTPSWFGLADENFKSQNFDEEDYIRRYFEIGEVSRGKIRKVIGRNNQPATASNMGINPNGKNNEAEDSDEYEEDYDVNELLAERLVDDIFAEVDTKKQTVSGKFLSYVDNLSLYCLDKSIKRLHIEITKLRQDNKIPNREQSIIKCENELRIFQNKRNFFDRIFTYYTSGRVELPDVTDLITEIKAGRISEIILQRIPRSERWALYLTIVDRARVISAEQAAEAGKELVRHQKNLRESQRLVDAVILQNSKVCGMTTTGAAKYNELLRLMRSKIVIVEEAAEVLEAHIVTCVTRHCEHLILIGDHRQLRPNPTVYELAIKFNLNISLFERMIKNNLNCYQLKVQHRMRPEIANLVVGTIYEELQNYPNVYQYPPVIGVIKNLFFISHTELEKSEKDSLSKCNNFEAKFLAAFSRYLILQGYGPDRITVLTTYLGQMFLIKKYMSEIPNCRGIRVTCVDNFQGEENDIILLSLVRSNYESNIGFLKIENRVCVAVSRARHGLYIIGNMGLLSSKSNIWSQIQEKLEARNEIGSFLTLECQVHGTKTKVESGNDFQSNAPEGGCRLVCDALLECSHRCIKVCHIKDREHEKYDCREPCLKSCINDHPCQFPCFRKCPPCPVVITKSLPQCGHEVDIACYQNPAEHLCKVFMNKKLPCGHETGLVCHLDPAEYTCKIKMRRILMCTHERELECHVDINSVMCKIIVEKELSCGHKQNAECRFSPDVIKCVSPVNKTLTDCGHVMEVRCGEQSKPVVCKNHCSIRLSCGHACTKYCHLTEDPHHLNYTCRKDCSKKCSEGHTCAVKHKCNTPCPPCLGIVSRKLVCGHIKDLPCHIDFTQNECLEPCERILNCRHKCQNLCFQPCGPCQTIVKKRNECGHTISIQCHIRPSQDLCVELVAPINRSLCGHNFPVPCNVCQTADPVEIAALCTNPCNEIFSVAEGGCGHRCKGTCSSCWQGRLHNKCQEKCGRTLVCGDVCDFPCSKSCPPCNKKCHMKCEHSECGEKCGTPCLGCSERCPWRCIHKTCTKLCREQCDRDPCNEPCTRPLPCGHTCIGYCGEPCPPHCRICDREHLTEFILLANEEDADARFIFLPDCKHSIEAEGLDYHMNLDANEIGMKECPRCKTLIRYCRRFNNAIRKRLEDVVAVKKRMFGDLENVKAVQNEVIQKLRWDDKQRWSRNFQTFHQFLLNKVVDIVPVTVNRGSNAERLIPKKVNEQELESIKFLVTCAEAAIDVLMKGRQEDGLKPELLADLHKRYRQLLSNIQNRQLPLGKPEIRDISRELLRLFDINQVYLRRSNPRFTDGHSLATPIYARILEILKEPKPYTGMRKQELHNLLSQLEDTLKTGLGISQMEIQQILRSFEEKGEGARGRWFKCKNGHYYIIGDCGGAMVEAKCSECDETIGGANHAIRRDNQLAPEVDGATASLWPGN